MAANILLLFALSAKQNTWKMRLKRGRERKRERRKYDKERVDIVAYTVQLNLIFVEHMHLKAEKPWL